MECCDRSSWFSSSGSGVGSVSGVGGPMSSSHSVLSASTLSLNAGKSRAGSSSLVGSGSGNSKQKEPRPQRTLLVTTAIVQGIREAILVTDEDINTLKNSLDDLSLQSQQVGPPHSLHYYYLSIKFIINLNKTIILIILHFNQHKF